MSTASSPLSASSTATRRLYKVLSWLQASLLSLEKMAMGRLAWAPQSQVRGKGKGKAWSQAQSGDEQHVVREYGIKLLSENPKDSTENR